MARTKQDPRVTKRRVTMTNITALPDGSGTAKMEAVDYVLPEELDAYVTAAKTNWQSVVVSDEPDAGPGGYDGQTVLLDGTVRPATKEG